MAGEWNRMKDKMGAPSGGPSPADWEAMRAKIDAQPALAPKAGKNPWYGWLIAASLGLMVGLGSWYFGGTDNGQNESPAQVNQSVDPIMEPSESAPISNKENHGNQNDDAQAEVESNSSKHLEKSLENAIAQEESKDGVSTKANQSALPVLNETAEKRQAIEENKLSTSQDFKDKDRVALSEMDQGNTRSEAENRSMEGTSLEESLSSEEKSKIAIADEPEAVETIEDSNNQGAATESGIPVEGLVDSDQDDIDQNRKSMVDSSGTQVAAPSEAKPFISPNTGFKLGGASSYIGAMHELRSQSPLVYGGGFELQWYNKGQYFSAGLAYYRIEQVYEQNVLNNYSRIDSSWKLNVEDKEVLEVSRIWVIDSFQAGHYEYDTTRTIVQDSTYVLQVDTNQLGSSIVKQLERPFYFAELPLLYGYGIRSGNWNFRLAGGLALQQAIAYSNDESGSKSLFGVTALLQPQIDWRLNDRWSVLSRVQLRYPIKQEFVLYEQTKLRYSFQMGVSYRW